MQALGATPPAGSDSVSLLAVGMGEYLVRREREAPTGLIIKGLGSCVAVFLHEPACRLGGLAHILLPEPMDGSPLIAPGRFVPTAVAGMLDMIFAKGGRRHHLTAKVAGGSNMFAYAHGAVRRETLGDRNIRAALDVLTRESIPVSGIDIGGRHGRTLTADIGTGTVRITSLTREPKEI